MSDPEAASGAEAAVNDAIKAVEAAEEIGSQTSKFLSSVTLQELVDCMNALETLFSPIESIVNAVQTLESNPDADIPAIGDISGSSQGDADSTAIVTVAAWDK